MTNPSSRALRSSGIGLSLSVTAVSAVIAVVAMLGAAPGCGGGDGGGGKGGTGGGGAGGNTGPCTAGGGDGTLTVLIKDAPGDAGDVTVMGGATPQHLTADMNLPLAAGTYTVTAERVADAITPTPLVRTAYQPTVDMPSACVRKDGTTTVNVTYAPIASSGKLWVGNNTAGKELLGFAATTVTDTGTHAADVAGASERSQGITFDAAGNLWALNASERPLARYPAAMLGTSGAKTPDITIDSPSFAGGIPGAAVLTFDDAGNLWVSVVAGSKVVRFTPQQIAATGTPTAAVEIGGISGPSGLAFDGDGNLFVASPGLGSVVRIDAAHLGATRMGGDLTITAMSPGPVIGPLTVPIGMAFDTSGNLWVNFNGTMARLTPANLAGTGTKNITPDVQITADVLALPEGIAFDEEGGLWFAYAAGKIARFSAAQLGTSGSVAPETIITSSDVGSAGWVAIYPAPAGTPLAHRIPRD